ncbi:hypothetical protein [Epilithonimonas hispanica]|uniref:Uncharacterized protein n=1 Tax=Epilithonimonas hispanica TaxID=358687 RepID=A0A3D9CXA3_9FLAO|nr:hypothetical protein [Epilithonimonas hispanica]REC70400.1 hypothetical protein DRF58_09555 [Epilithonimonas hispanica]
MKKQLYIYAVLIILFVAYNFYKPIKDERTDAVINILFTSVLFLYIAYIAYLVLKKIGKKEK